MLATHVNANPPTHQAISGALTRIARIERLPAIDAGHHDDARGESRARRLQNARELLRSRYFEAISMQDLAVAACMSLHHFMRCYSAEFGRSAHDELIALRVGLAEHLLTTTKLRVRQIATAVGFESRTTLFRHFIRHHGRSPDEYRREQCRLDRILRCDVAPWLLMKRKAALSIESFRASAAA